MELRLRILTLNCWGLVVISKHRRKRILAIGNELASGDYDFVVLQEIWCKSDYECIVNQTRDVLPYSHYFYSGVIGSGLCVFSKVPIVDVLFLPFSLNGYPHMIAHGDWFSGKGVGMCRVTYEGLEFNIFTAHLHAEYSLKTYNYLHHRLCQAFEISQFAKFMSRTSHLTIVAGDFNSEPHELPYRLILSNGNLKDAFVEQEQTVNEDLGSTNGHPRNTYTTNSSGANLDIGQRIDYIFYNNKNDVGVRVLSCDTPLDKCPNELMSFSDHEAVVATFLVSRPVAVVPQPIVNFKEQQTTLAKTKEILDEQIRQLYKDKIFYFIISSLLVCLVFGSIGMDSLPYIPAWLMAIIRVFLSILMAFCFWMGSVWNAIERSCIVSTSKAASLLIGNIANELQ
ncbi:hypothetical protein CHUAL_010807 [Chamberlinius hualienensis]